MVIPANWGTDLTLFFKSAKDYGLNINYFTMNANNPGTPAQIGSWGEVKMRKTDHQLEAPLYLGIWAKKGSKGVKYDAENTGYGFRTEAAWDNYISAQPTSCQMKRPS